MNVFNDHIQYIYMETYFVVINHNKFCRESQKPPYIDEINTF